MTCCPGFLPQSDVKVHVLVGPPVVELVEIRIRCGGCGTPRAFKLTAPPRAIVNGVSAPTTHRDRLHVQVEPAPAAPRWAAPPAFCVGRPPCGECVLVVDCADPGDPGERVCRREFGE